MANIFSRSANWAPIKIIIGIFFLATVVTSAVTYYATPKYLRVGYQPKQPVPFDHSWHAGKDGLGLDCRFCHNNVTKSEHSNVPPTSTCMSCHAVIKTTSPKLAPVRESLKSGQPIEWIKVHKTPDYVYFNHAAHVNRGVSCVACHGRVDEMQTVKHAKSHSMAFCLDCHRNPQDHVRPIEHVFDLGWQPDGATTKEQKQAQRVLGGKLVADWKIQPPKSCFGCHR
jgi:hypothetical protein